ncbi:MAG: polysaccharide deacetylase family protein [Synergistaceae bacterium]|jgi:peptidoglycan/xylan/chitin deacetylase (PgdA/CDA1 family)|nr:polysaccharide deacetylase family protein [Synergistaceae bacterium]
MYRNGRRLRGLERNLLAALLVLFLCVEWGPLSDERARWGIASGNPFVKEVALTFDDGPRDRGMPELLAALRRLDVPGTFFLVGKFAERYGPITKSIAAEGHEIENHSYTHPQLTTLWVEKIMREAERCNEVMNNLAIRTPRFLRPPGGGFNLKIFYALRRMKMRMGLWSVNTADYTGRPAHKIIADVLRGVRPGSIVLMHSGVPATVEALPAIVSELRARGYRFVTVQDLWNGGAI